MMCLPVPQGSIHRSANSKIVSTRTMLTALWIYGGLLGQSAEAQAVKKSGGAAAEKPAVKFQLDFRVQISSSLDKQRGVIWMSLLKELGAAGVSQVPGEPGLPKEGEPGEPAVESGGAGRLIVRGMIGPSGNLFIGGEAFRMADRAKLGALIKNLQIEGMAAADPTAPMWGLSPVQIERLHAELKQPSAFELKEKPFDAFIADLRGRIKLEIKVTPESQQLARGLKLNGATGDLSLGAALAFVLDQHGLEWEPRSAAGNSVTLLILPRVESKRPWPVGLPPEQFPGNLAPQLMANARYQTNNMPLDEVLAVFRRELKMDVLLDRTGLIEHEVNPDKLRCTVQITGGTFQSAIKKTLAVIGLRHELRLDEANRPFLWVTWSEPTGPVKKK